MSLSIEQQLQQQKLMNRILRILHESDGFEEIARIITHQLCTALQVRGCLLGWRESTQSNSLFKIVGASSNYQSTIGAIGYYNEESQIILNRGQPLVITANLDAKSLQFVPPTRELSVAALFILPLIRQQDYLGSLILLQDEPRTWTIDRVEFGQTIAEHSAIALVNAERYQQLQAQQDRESDRFFKFATDLMAIVDFSGTLRQINPAWEKTLGYAPTELIGITFYNLLHPDDLEATTIIWETQVKAGIPVTAFPNRFRCKDGSYKWLSWHHIPFIEERLSYGFARDITQQKQTEEALKISEARFRLALNCIPEVVVLYDVNRRFQFVNTAGLQLSQKTLDDHLGRTDEEVWPSEVTQAYLPLLHRAVETRTIQVGECHLTLPKELDLEIKYIPILNEAGEIYQILGVTHNITQYKQTQQQLQASLQEKEVLLKEVHHRVKNNLQVISSLLDLQSLAVEDLRTQEMFQISQTRIKSMALIHENLYQAQSWVRINFADYVKNLTDYLLGTYLENLERITLHLAVNDINLNIDTAIPCGLIINELITNTLKHAFIESQTGNIWLELKPVDRQYRLMVKDDGANRLDPREFRNPKSLGLQLVIALVSQIQGKIEIDSSQGTTIQINFPQLKT